MARKTVDKREKAQTVSFDALIGIGLFIVAAMLLFYITGRESGVKKSESLEKESEKLAEVIGSPQNVTGTLLSGSKVEQGKLQEVSNLSYELLKTHLGVKSDFCIYFEDEKGNIVPVTGDKLGLGSPLVNLSGQACNSTLS